MIDFSDISSGGATDVIELGYLDVEVDGVGTIQFHLEMSGGKGWNRVWVNEDHEIEYLDVLGVDIDYDGEINDDDPLVSAVINAYDNYCRNN